MNSLQSLQTDTNYFVTINPVETIRPEHIIKTIQYAHPCYTMDTLDAQRRLATINGQNRTHFCGAYCGYGFHEDGITSGLAVANKLGVTWNTPPIKETNKPYEVIHSNGQADALPAYTH
jgi:predicted NAD/FAD-binding protein